MHLDDLSSNGHLEGLLTFSEDCDSHHSALGSPELSDGLHQSHILGWLTVDSDDAVPGLDPGPVRRGLVDRGHDCQMSVPHRDLDSEPAEAALCVDLHLLVDLGRHKGAVRI